ncbi:NACHT domain-containing protein [Streptomyces sp. 7R007]
MDVLDSKRSAFALNLNEAISSMDLKTVLVTATVTLIATPLILMVARRLGAFLRQNVRMWLEAGLFRLGKWSRSSLAKRVSLREYCRYGLGDVHTRYLQVPGRDETGHLEADSAFVSLKLQNGAASFVYSGDVAEIQDMPRLRVIGDPGSGKSSLAKKMFRDACREAMAFRAGHRLPILVELKRFTPPKNRTADKARADWAMKFLREHVARVQGFEMGELFDAYVRRNGLFLILDGLDEVAGSDFPRVAATLRALSDRLAAESPHNSVVLTMRSQFHSQVSDHLEADFPPVFHVQPFSPEDVYVFLTKWPDYAGDKRAEILRLYNNLTDRPTLREMCGNPLVLAMYVSHDQHGAKGMSVDTRTAFYSKVVEELLVARRGRQLEIPAKSLLREQRETLFGRLAFEHMCDPEQAANSLSWPRAIDTVAEIYQCGRAEAEQRFRELAKETGLVSEERSGESYRFIHLTFCEFFAAKEAAEGRADGWAELMDAHHAFAADPDAYTASRLGEVLPFALALLPRSRRADALQELGDRGVGSLVLGRCFLETQLYDHPSWAVYAADESVYLTRAPSGSWDDAWLRRLHLFNVVLKDAEEWRTEYGRRPQSALEDLFHTLVQDDRARLVQLFSSYAAVDAPAAMRLAEAIGVDLVAEQPGLVVDNMSYPPFRAMVLEKVKAETSPSDDLVLLVAEAGLRHQSVAVECAAEEVPGWFIRQTGRIGVRHEWFKQDHRHGWDEFRPSLYTYCLSYAAELARSGTIRNTSEFPGVRAISDVPAPGSVSLRSMYLLRAYAFAMGAVLTALVFAIVFNIEVLLRPFLTGPATWAAGLGEVTMFASFELCTAPQIQRGMYVTLVNLRTEEREPHRGILVRLFLLDIMPSTIWLRRSSTKLVQASRALERALPPQLEPRKHRLPSIPRPRSGTRTTQGPEPLTEQTPPITEQTPPTRQPH